MGMFKAALFIFTSLLGLTEGDRKLSFEYQGKKRNYLLHLPQGYTGEDAVPLLISLHGFGETASMHQRTTRMNQKADKEGFVAAYPNGTGFPRAWNAGIDLDRRKSTDDVGFISALIDTLVSNYNIDGRRVYVTGFSNGAMMAHLLGCKIPEKIAAIAPVSGGLMLDMCEPDNPVPVIAFHALNDPIVKYEGDTMGTVVLPGIDSVMQEWAERNGCDHGPDSFYAADGKALRQRWWNREGTEVILWTTKEGKHTWPGGKGIPFPGAARPSKDIHANKLMWEFFSRHRR